MTKINEGLFICDWCDTKIKFSPEKYVSPTDPLKTSKGKQNVTNALRCPKCLRIISQRSKLDRMKK